MALPKPLASLLVAFLWAGSLCAQGSLSSPAGYLGQESADGIAPYSMFLGGYPEQRFQLADGNLRGRGLTLTAAELRRDTQPGFESTGRSWTAVTLRVGETNLASFGQTFSQNRVGAMATVFRAAATWPKHTGLSTRPAPWGTVGLRFPFASPVVYSGKRDLLLEYVFAGGTLDNSTTWNAGSLHSYYLDGISGSHHAVSTSRFFGSTGCKDGSQQNGAVQRLYVLSHAKSSPAYPNQFSHYQESYNTAPRMRVLQGIGISGSSTGTEVGTCNRLHILPLATFALVADTDGYTRMSLGSAPYSSSVVGLKIWAQTAWADSRTNGLKLTNAAQATVVAQPAPLAWRSLVTTTTNHPVPLASVVGTFYQAMYVPLHRYQHK